MSEDTVSVTDSNEKPIDINLFGRKYRRKLAECDDFELNENQTIGDEIVKQLKKVVNLPNDFAYSVIAAYCCVPSVLSDILPILYIQGSSGSGKSQILKLLSRVLGQKLVVGASTAASLKNEINSLRFRDGAGCTVERNYHLLIDNVNTELFQADQALGVLLNGYDRETDQMLISDGRGGNIRFFPFGPKVISSTHEVDNPEIWRRTLLIQCKKTQPEQLRGLKRPSDLPLSGLKKVLQAFWNEEQNWEMFLELKHSIDKLNKPDGMSNEFWVLVNDVIASGVTCGVWNNASDSFNGFINFFNLQRQSKSVGLLGAIVKKGLENGTGLPADRWMSVSAVSNITITCSPKEVKKVIAEAIDSGLPLRQPSVERLQDIAFLRKMRYDWA